MADLERSLQHELTAARKAQAKERTLLLGSIVAAVRYRHLEIGRELTDDDVMAVLAKGVKQRRESVEQFRKGGRVELANQEENEIAILEEFLPAPIDPEEIRLEVRRLVATGLVQMGPLMGALMSQFQGRVDGRVLSQIVREELPTT